MFELRRRCLLRSENDGPIFCPGKKHTRTQCDSPSPSLLLSLKLHRFQQRYTSSAEFDCTGLLAPSLHQWSCLLSVGRHKTRTQATFLKMTVLYETLQRAMDLWQHCATVPLTVTQIDVPPVGLLRSHNIQDFSKVLPIWKAHKCTLKLSHKSVESIRNREETVTKWNTYFSPLFECFPPQSGGKLL